MLSATTDIPPKATKNKKAQKFVKYLTKNQISNEDLPIYYNDSGHALIVMNDRMDSTGYPYNWEVIFNPAQEVVVVKAAKIVEKIQNDLIYHVLEIINEKNKAVLWGKFFLHNNSIYMMAPLISPKNKLKPAYILQVIQAMRQSIEEIHSETMKVFL